MNVPPRPAVLVLTTGGTIVSTRREGRKVYPGSNAEIGRIIAAQAPGTNVVVEDVCTIGSQNISIAEWRILARRISETIGDGSANAIIITHGTDTMEDTAFLLDCLFPAGPPVILTGATLPSDAPDADGPANLADAIRLALSAEASARGVMVVMDGCIHAADLVRKAVSKGRHVFVSDGPGPVGSVNAAGATFHARAPRVERLALALPQHGALPRVELVMVGANTPAETLHWWSAAPAVGLVIAGLADGNLSQSAISGLSALARHGRIIVRASAVNGEAVRAGGEIDDAAAGFIPGGLLTPGKARILLQLLLANHLAGPRLQQAFAERARLRSPA